ncbi:MAG: hypothetical protein EOP48_11150 [Sphingobacteriales bacterium]|nr:MAG: hypothetical protein EOP48_11150 [Sphingobacteriales bacterium]
MVSIFLSIGDLELLDDVSATTAQRRITEIKTQFAIGKYKKISVVDYANFHKFEIDFVINMLERKRQARRR